MADVFLSYKREDQQKAREVAADLEAEGFSVFFDVRIEVGDAWDEVIERELNNSRAVVVLWSTRSRESPWVRREAREALERRILCPASVDRCKVPLEFSDVQAADLINRAPGDFAHTEWRRLCERVGKCVGRAPLHRGAQPQRAPAPPQPEQRAGQDAGAVSGLFSNVSRRALIVGGVTVAGAGAAVAGYMTWTNAAAPGNASAELSAFLDRLTTEALRESPEYATTLAVTEQQAGGRYIDRLGDRSREGFTRVRDANERALTGLQRVNRNRLTGQDAVTYDVALTSLQSQIDASRFTFGYGAMQPYAVTQLTGSYRDIPGFLDSQHPLTNRDQADAYLLRLTGFARALDQETAVINEDAFAGMIPPDFAIDGASQGLRGFTSVSPAQSVLVGSLHRRLPEIAEVAEADRSTFVTRAEAIVRDEVFPAYQRQLAALMTIRPRASHAAGIGERPQGAEIYESALRYHTTTMLNADEIHALGVELVGQYNAQADLALRTQGLTAGTVVERMASLSSWPGQFYADTDFGRTQALNDLNRLVQTVQARMSEQFSRAPRASLEIRRVPPSIEATAPGGYYQPAALDGSRPGVYYINLRSMADWPRFTLPTLVFHETVPGHHTQVSVQQEAGELPLYRSALSYFNAYSEGWALYAEQLADEMGFYADDPLGRLGYLKSMTFRAARLVVDTGIHAKGWTREQAIQYLSSVTGDPPERSATEVERYAVWPGQACSYMVGHQTINRMRDRARQTLGSRFDLRTFHDALLTNGSVPLSVAETLIDNWIASVRSSA